jgi:carbamoyltransferase
MPATCAVAPVLQSALSFCPEMPTVLGISAYYHDAAAALVRDGKIVAAVQEERFSRKKNDAAFPAQSIQYCLQAAGLGWQEIDAIVFYDKPLLKFERLLETHLWNAPRGFLPFLKAMPVWMRQKLFLKAELKKELSALGMDKRSKVPLLFSSHHLSHAASAFYPSPFEEAAVLTIDGVGEWATASIASGKGNTLTLHKEMHYPNSLGLLYSAFTYYLGFKVNEGEYKVMGLAPYGDPHAAETKANVERITGALLTVFEDGSIQLNEKYFSFGYALRMVPDAKWEALFQLKRRLPEEDITAAHCNLALALQMVTESIVLQLAAHARQLTGLNRLCLAGGVALNCVANGKLRQSGMFSDYWIQPAAGDAGGALGAALAVTYQYFHTRRQVAPGDTMQGAFLGPEPGEVDIPALQAAHPDLHIERFEDEATLAAHVAAQLVQGKIVGWCRGRMEFGPRALGARSILADPTFPGMQKKLNLHIKNREAFRPFAPVMLQEEARQFYNASYLSPYMLLVAPLVEKYRLPVPENYAQMPLMERLYTPRSKLQAVVHVDFSSRLQICDSEQHPLWNLLHASRQLTGTGMLVNTSFNVKDQPIVATAMDALNCFLTTRMDSVVIVSTIISKKETTP